LDYVDAAHKGPTSLVAKFSPLDLDERRALRAVNLREISFYRTLATQQSLPIADYYYADFDLETGASILLLQDLSGMRTVDFLEGCSLEDAAVAVRALAQIHAAWWNHPELEAMSWLSSLADWPYQEWWDKYPQEIKSLLPEFEIPDSFFDFGQRFSSNMSRILDRLEGPPQTLIHRDIHVDNLLFDEHSSGSPVLLVDWQSAGRGLGISDIAYFLISSLPIAQRRQAEHTLVQSYHNLLLEADIQDYSFDQCWSDYIFSAVAKLFITVIMTVEIDNSSEHRQQWRTVDLQRLLAFIEDHNPHENL
jgi:thiamine kinase-like enzyme